MKTKSKIYIISIFFLVFYTIIIFISFFLYNKIIEKSKNLTDEENKTMVLKNQMVEIEAFKIDNKLDGQNLEKIDNMFVDSQNPVDFVEFLDKSAADSGIKLNMSALTFSKNGLSNSADSQLSLIGNLPEIITFLKVIENGPYLIKINNLDITNDQLDITNVQNESPVQNKSSDGSSDETIQENQLQANMSIDSLAK